MENEKPESMTPSIGTAEQAKKMRNDAARVLLGYLNYVAMFQSDEKFGMHGVAVDAARVKTMTLNCRAAAFKLGLIGFVRDKIVLTDKGKRFVPNFTSNAEKKPTVETPVVTQ